MFIQINPHSLLNLQNICEVLYKLHPSVLHDLVEIERSLGGILGYIDLNNLTMDEREFLANTDFSQTSEVTNTDFSQTSEVTNTEVNHGNNSEYFHKLRKYLKLDTDEYIPMKIYVEVEDPILGRKVKEFVRALEKTRAPEQFYYHKREVDEDAYFAEGYGLTMNEEQRKQRDDFFNCEDVKSLEKLLRKKSLI